MGSLDFKLADGRNLDLLIGAGSSQTAIIFHHGTPSCANIWKPWVEHFEKLGIRSIAYSRAGYYTSDRKVGRDIVSVNSDIAEVLDHFSIDSFVAVGWSGGGPHALASTLDPRCKSAVVLAGVGMYDQPDLDFLAGMGEENLDEFGHALKGEAELSKWMEANASAYKTITGEELRNSVGTLYSESDIITMQRKDYSDGLAEVYRRSLEVSYSGWIDDDIAFAKDWGFTLDQVKVPVAIFQGDEDLMVPGSHGRWLHNHLPHSTLRMLKGQGHLSFFSASQAEILGFLLGVL